MRCKSRKRALSFSERRDTATGTIDLAIRANGLLMDLLQQGKIDTGPALIQNLLVEVTKAQVALVQNGDISTEIPDLVTELSVCVNKV